VDVITDRPGIKTRNLNGSRKLRETQPAKCEHTTAMQTKAKQRRETSMSAIGQELEWERKRCGRERCEGGSIRRRRVDGCPVSAVHGSRNDQIDFDLK